MNDGVARETASGRGGVRTGTGGPARRHALLSGVALTTVFLFLGAPGEAQAACSIVGTTQTCTGLLGDGVVATNPVETLVITGVTGKIWPDNAGVNAIDFQSTGPITITSDTGNFETIAVDADGIYANSSGGSITIDHAGDIVSTGGYGVRTLSRDDTSVALVGDIEGTLGGISAWSEFGDVVREQQRRGLLVWRQGHRRRCAQWRRRTERRR
jgi:hypothetical protein